MKMLHVNPGTIKKVLSIPAAILLSVCVGSLILVCVGKNPIQAFSWMFAGALGNAAQISVTLNKMSVFILCGLSCAAGYKCGLINLGAQGQMIMGALGSCVVGIVCENLPKALVHILAIAAGILCGSLWGALTGALKVCFGANEVITTVMLNYIAILFVDYLTNGPLKDPGMDAAKTQMLKESLWLKNVISGTKIHMGIILSVLLLIAFGLFFKYAKMGFAIRVTGLNLQAARHSGIPVKRYRFWSMALCGATAGLAGFLEVFGTQHQLISGFATEYGFDGIAVALLGQGQPIGILFSSLLFAVMKTGGTQMQMFAGVPYALVGVLQGLMIVFILAVPGVEIWRNNRRAKV